MNPHTRQAGPVERAVLGYHPTESVLLEAAALDRELAAARRTDQGAWEALIRSMVSFSTWYPAILLRAREALDVLGQACLDGVQQAPGMVLRNRAAGLLVDMLGRVLDEAQREGPDRVPGEVPAAMRRLLGRFGSGQRNARQHPELEPALLAFGKRVLVVGGEGYATTEWFALLDTVTRLLLDIIIFRVEGEPFYDGRWDATRRAQALEVDMLGPVRRANIEVDLEWLRAMRGKLEEGAQSGTDVFLELSAYANRDQREETWGAWFDAVATRAVEGGLRPGELDELSRGFADWIEQARDRRFLARLAAMLRRVAADVAAANGRAGLITALETFGCAITDRLELDAGRGEVDKALDDLRTTVVELLGRLLASAGRVESGPGMECGLRARTGPVLGVPFDRQDAIWRMRMVARHPSSMDALLYDLLAGLCLEEVVLRDDVAGAGEERGDTVGAALADMLRRPWEGERRYAVRSLIRVTPLSPFHLGEASTRSRLLALASPSRSGSYLHDLQELVLSRPGPESLQAVEQVLRFWQSGDSSHLDNLADPASLAALPAQAREDNLEHVRELMARLERHAPGAGEGGIRWLARLPDAFYSETTLIKVAGFPGCSSQALFLLVNMLHVYRDLVGKYEPGGKAADEPARTPRQLLERLELLTGQRRELAGRLFTPGGLEGLDPIGCLDLFHRELDLAAEAGRVCETLAGLLPDVSGPEDRDAALALVGAMMTHASLSGLQLEGPREELGASGSRPERVGPALRRVLDEVESVRSRLAARLEPHVLGSVRRLRANPLARPADPYRRLFENRAAAPPEELAGRAALLLAEDLLSADGGLLLLEHYLRRLLGS